MPYINPGQFIEPYLRPLGKQTIKQIPQIQQEQRAREQLGAQKSVWAEQIAESQANRAIQRDAQTRWAELENLPAEAFKGIVPEGIDKDTFLNMIRSGAMKAPTPTHKKELPPVWKEVEYINEQGQRVKKHINVNDLSQQREFPVPTRKVRINGKWMDVRNEVADRIEAMDREELRKDEEFQREQDEKAKNQRIDYLQKKVEWAIAVKSPEMLKYYNGLLDKEVDISSEGIATDPKMDKVRSTIMQANQIIGRYEKIASQDPEDMGAMLAPTSQAPIPEKRYLMPPSKAEKKLTPSQQLNQLKLAAWEKYLADPSSTTAEENRLIKVDIDPYVARAAQLIANDMTTAFLPIKQKVEKILSIAESIRSASTDKPESDKIKLPSTIKKTSEAIKYLMSKGMSKEESIGWLRSQQ